MSKKKPQKRWVSRREEWEGFDGTHSSGYDVARVSLGKDQFDDLGKSIGQRLRPDAFNVSKEFPRISTDPIRKPPSKKRVLGSALIAAGLIATSLFTLNNSVPEKQGLIGSTEIVFEDSCPDYGGQARGIELYETISLLAQEGSGMGISQLLLEQDSSYTFPGLLADTRETIRQNQDKLGNVPLDAYGNPDLSLEKLANGRYFLVQPGVELNFTKETESQKRLEEIIARSETPELSSTGEIILDYFFCTNKVEREEGLEEQLMTSLASRYNQGDVVFSDYSRKERLSLAAGIYKFAKDRKKRESFVTLREILALANDSNDGKRITAEDIRCEAGMTRKVSLRKSKQARQAAVYHDYLEKGIGKDRSGFVESLASKYGVSRSTIYRDLREASKEVIEPKYIFA